MIADWKITGSAAVVLLAGCGPDRGSEIPQSIKTSASQAEVVPLAAEDPEMVAERARMQLVDTARKTNREVNWMNIGITTGKFSESLSASVHQTYEECVIESYSEDNECVPIAPLPESYWNAKETDALP